MTELDNIRKEARKATELDTPQDRAKAYRVVLSSAINYIFEQSKVKKPETASLLELIDSETVSAFIGDSDLINSLHYIRILGINAEHEQKIKKAEDKLAQSNLLYLIGLLEAQKSGTRAEYQKPPYMSEATTRKLYIDLYLREAGWDVLETENVCVAGKAGIEIQVNGMPNSQGIGFCDYVLYGRDGKPLAIVEAKKTSVSPEKGRHQVDLYGDCMKAVYGYKPILYYTNGYTTKIIDGLYPDRTVMAFHTIDELELMLQRRNRSDITDTKVDPRVAGRPYQSMAITNLCEWFNQKHRRGLLVMATGTGKTRVSIALVDVLTRNNWVKNVLFLADRTSLVHQAKVNFNKLLPNMSICELSSSDEKDYNARLMFCTYQTMINYIDAEDKRFTSGRFDLIIIDEAHRSIFNKYGSIFSYFDSLLVGLTATPKSEVDANTYRVFGCESGMPNFDYSLEEAVKDHYLVNYKSFNRTTKILSRGAKYNQLSEEDKLKVDQYLIEEPPTPDFTISEKSFFKIIYNKDTCKRIIEEFMTNGIKTNGGELIGKTIVFAYNHHHAEMIVECFHEMYPNYPANYCQLVDNYVKYADDLITRFEEDEEFRVAVSVDMLDTGIDVPAVVNLVFFKPVKSKIKFVQMIGRGTRLCPDLFGKGKDKTHFIIFDYCGNFEYFDQNPDGTDGSSALSLSQRFFEIRLDILYELQRIEYQSTEFGRSYYQKLKETLHSEICNIKKNSARLQVRAAMEWVDRYSDFDVWTCLSPVMVKEIKLHLVPLLDSGIKDKDLVIAFDIRMLDVELSVLLQGNVAKANRDVKVIREVAQYLLTKASVPQIFEKAEQLKALVSDQFWSSPSVERMEVIREEVRDLMKYLEGGKKVQIDVDIQDETESSGYQDDGGGFDIRTYREKVLDYLAAHSDSPVLRKIQHMEQINASDLKELEHILWDELGTKEDYEKSTNIDNLAVFVRSLIGLSQDAINEKFGDFLNGNTLNAQQQEFVKAIINYVRENGDIRREDLIEKSPFDNYDILTLFGENITTVLTIVNVLHDSVNVAA